MVNSIESCLTKIDTACDYIPGISTVSNLIDLFQKCVVLPLMEKSNVAKSHYYTHLQQKSFLRCIALLFFPVLGNIIVGIYDFNYGKYNDKDFMLAAVQQDGLALEYASEQLKSDKNLVLAAIHQNQFALRFIRFP